MADTFNSSGDEMPDQSEALASDDDTAREDQEREQEEKVLAEAKARLELSEEAEQDIRRLALEDLEFRSGKQWPEMVQAERDRDRRPCLVINRMPQFIQQVTNDQRQNRPSIKVHPLDNEADVETAKVIQGLIRHIEYNSNADVAYDTAFESAATGGYGYFRFVTDYVSPMSFDQEILFKRVRNPFSVFFDPHSVEPDGSDASYAFIVDDLSPEEYKSRYPDSKLSSMGEWSAIGNTAPGWMPEGSARVAEYFCKEFKEVKIHLLSNGAVVAEDKLEAYAQRIFEQSQGAPQNITITNTRTSKVPVIKWYKLNAIEVLEQTEWPGKYIPIVPVYGSELYVNGKRILEGIVRNAKDSQRMYNYWASAETEAIALAPRTPFLVAEGQIEGYENEWATANQKNHAYLPYKPTSSGGVAVPPPMRQTFEPAVQAITQARGLAADDLKATTGIYDASLGAQSNETSGVAIQRRNVQAQTSNFHFIDNLTRSLRHAGRILVDLIPRIYDTARTARIIGEDGEQSVVKLNQAFDENGKQVLYQLDTGTYDVTVDVGPSFASKRQEAVAAMMDMTKSWPQLAQLAGDIMVKNMDWQGAQEISERIKKSLPPGLADDPKKAQQPLPPEVQQKMQQMGQMVDQLTKQLHSAHDMIDQKRPELESRERIEMAKIQADIEIAMLKAGSTESIALLKHEIQAITSRLNTLGFNGQPSQPLQDFAPSQAPGGQPADGGQGMMPQPTGGYSPGQPMEGN